MGSGRFRLWLAIMFGAPFLLLLVLGVRDLSSAFFDQRKLADAAFEATKWARADRFDPDGITKAAQSATSLPTISVSSYRPCGCPSGAGLALSRCDSICPDNSSSQPYIVVTTAMCHSTAFTWPGVSYCSNANSQCAAAGCTRRQILLSAQSLVPQ